jgi:hypothetical protein
VNLTLSPQIRIVALVGALAVVGLAGSMLVLNRGGSSSDSVAGSTAAVVTRPSRLPVKAHARPAVTPKPAVHAKTHAAVKHHAVRVHHARKPAGFHGNRVYAQLPQPLQWQLAHHKIVVVSVYNPQSDVDSISVAEAHAGAVDAHAGFLLVSVLDNKVAGILTALLPGGGLLPDPGVLVYRAPGDIALRLDGFADRAAVAQAATNALAGETEPAPTAAAPSADPAAVAAPAAATP